MPNVYTYLVFAQAGLFLGAVFSYLASRPRLPPVSLTEPVPDDPEASAPPISRSKHGDAAALVQPGAIIDYAAKPAEIVQERLR